jgi:hypothetical protein
MSIVEFFREAPELAAIIALVYLVLLGVFFYMLVRMYRTKR